MEVEVEVEVDVRGGRWEVGNGNEDDSSTCKDPYHGMVTVYLLPTISFSPIHCFLPSQARI